VLTFRVSLPRERNGAALLWSRASLVKNAESETTPPFSHRTLLREFLSIFYDRRVSGPAHLSFRSEMSARFELNGRAHATGNDDESCSKGKGKSSFLAPQFYSSKPTPIPPQESSSKVFRYNDVSFRPSSSLSAYYSYNSRLPLQCCTGMHINRIQERRDMNCPKTPPIPLPSFARARALGKGRGDRHEIPRSLMHCGKGCSERSFAESMTLLPALFSVKVAHVSACVPAISRALFSEQSRLAIRVKQQNTRDSLSLASSRDNISIRAKPINRSKHHERIEERIRYLLSALSSWNLRG